MKHPVPDRRRRVEDLDPTHEVFPMLSVRRTAAVTGACAALLLSAVPVAARPDLTEASVRSTPGRQVIHLRIQTGCGDAPTDRVELDIPESVIGVVAEAKPGWIAETDVEATDAYQLFGTEQTERVSTIRWTGGSIPADQFLDFALAAVFTEEGEIAFPVTQGCGTEEVTFAQVPEPDAEGKNPADAVTIDVVPVPAEVDVVALQEGVEALRTTVEALRTELDEVPIARLRERIGALEDRVAELETALGVDSPDPAAQ